MNNEDKLIPSFPEQIDLKITNRCDLNCPMCHEKSVCDGKHADFNTLVKILNSCESGTELALGGGNPLEYPRLRDFLDKAYENEVICNMTINGLHLLQYDYLMEVNRYQEGEKIMGLGVSLPQVKYMEVIESAKNFRHVVFHIIAGMATPEQIEALCKANATVLILGYKQKGRGVGYMAENQESIEKNIQYLKDNLLRIAKQLNTISFDNLAIKQLDIQSFCKANNIEFNKVYMGDDGDYTMYIDAVSEEFAESQVSNKRFSIKDSSGKVMKVASMFNIL